MRPYFVSLASVLAAALIAASVAGCGDSPRGQRGSGRSASEEVRPQRVFLTPVVTRTVERGEVVETLSPTGTIIPERSATIRAEEAGRVRFERDWREGDLVTEGELIAKIESPALDRELELNRLEITIQRENVDIAERTMRSRRREFHQLQELYARGVTALREVEGAELEAERARNSHRQSLVNLDKALATLEETERRVARLEIRAPWDGLLVTLATLQGEGTFRPGFGAERIEDIARRDVTSGQGIAGLLDTGRVVMRCDITSRDIQRVQLGQRARIVVFSSPEIIAEGEVTRISDTVNPDTRAFEVDVAIANPERAVRPNMFGRAEIAVAISTDAIAVPRSAISRRNNRDVVFVAREDEEMNQAVARMIEVETGLQGTRDVEIITGLQRGDRVIVRGFEVLQDNTPIRAVDEDAVDLPGEAEELSVGE